MEWNLYGMIRVYIESVRTCSFHPSFCFLFRYSFGGHMNPRNNPNISNDNTILFQTKLLVIICSSNKATLDGNEKIHIEYFCYL